VRYKIEEAASLVKVHHYGGQNSWWAASNVEGVLKLQWKRGARALRCEALREMRFQIWKNTHIRRATVRPPTQKNHQWSKNLYASFADVFSTKISEHSPLRNLM